MPGVLRACLLAVLAAAGAPAASAAQALRIYDIDVEQAAATLIVSPSGHTLLVDSGKNGHGPRILAALQAAGVASIDHFVADVTTMKTTTAGSTKSCAPAFR